MTDERGRRRIRDPRSTLMFMIGLLIVVHELLAIWFSDQDLGERPFLLGVATAMMGLPAFLSLDERKQGRRGEDKPE